MKLPAALLLALLPGLAAAQAVVQRCDETIAAAENIAEPWAENSRSFADGAVRIAVLDTIEPAAAAFHLLVLSPPRNELGGRQCRIVSAGQGAQGFAGLSLEGMTSGYDPAVGLVLGLRISRYVPETGGYRDAWLGVTINQATGAIGAR